MRPYGERSGESQKVLVEWLERVGPEFKLQYCKKKNKTKKTRKQYWARCYTSVISVFGGLRQKDPGV
jgi:hypothetical protein